MIKKFLAYSFTAALTASCLVFSGMNANAASVDDVAAVARSYGYSEDMIQMGYNEYYLNQEEYPPERLDRVIGQLHAAGSQIITTGPQVTDAYTTTVTTSSTTAQNTDVQTTVSGGNSAGVVTTVPNQPDSTPITLKTDDGASFDRISKKDFIALSYEDKMKYISSFTPEQQQAIINSLSPEEYQSILKQSPVDQKAQIVDKLSDAVEEMGLNINVDDISDDSLTISIINKDGELVNRTTAGDTVENTGYNRSMLFATAGGLLAAALGILFLLMCYSFAKKDRIEGTNEK